MAAVATRPQQQVFAAGIIFAGCARVLEPYRVGKPRNYTLAENAPKSLRQILEKCATLAQITKIFFLCNLEPLSSREIQKPSQFCSNHLQHCFKPETLSSTMQTLRELANLVLSSCNDERVRLLMAQSLELLKT